MRRAIRTRRMTRRRLRAYILARSILKHPITTRAISRRVRNTRRTCPISIAQAQVTHLDLALVAVRCIFAAILTSRLTWRANAVGRVVPFVQVAVDKAWSCDAGGVATVDAGGVATVDAVVGANVDWSGIGSVDTDAEHKPSVEVTGPTNSIQLSTKNVREGQLIVHSKIKHSRSGFVSVDVDAILTSVYACPFHSNDHNAPVTLSDKLSSSINSIPIC
jgi:hypothetical protein